MAPVKEISTRVVTIFLVATLLNYPWEIAQAPLYIGMSEFPMILWHCLRAALGDGVLVVLVFALGAAALRRTDWYRAPGAQGYAVMLGAGLLIGIAVEWVGLHALQRWSYAAGMPVIPVLGVGVAPVAQMLLLPPLVFWLVAKRSRFLN